MKRCNYFMDLIITDYVDGRLEKKTTEILEAHLLGCHDCQTFLKEVKTTLSPIGQTSPQPVPTELWQKITENLQEQAQGVGVMEGFIHGLRGWLVLPKLVPALASVVMVLVVGSVSFNTFQLRQAQENEQGQYLASVIGNTNPAATAETNDLGTPLEQYFL